MKTDQIQWIQEGLARRRSACGRFVIVSYDRRRLGLQNCSVLIDRGKRGPEFRDVMDAEAEATRRIGQ